MLRYSAVGNTLESTTWPCILYRLESRGTLVSRISLPTFSVFQMCMFSVTSHVCVHECYSQDPASTSPLLGLASLHVGSEYQSSLGLSRPEFHPLSCIYVLTSSSSETAQGVLYSQLLPVSPSGTTHLHHRASVCGFSNLFMHW